MSLQGLQPDFVSISIHILPPIVTWPEKNHSNHNYNHESITPLSISMHILPPLVTWPKKNHSNHNYESITLTSITIYIYTTSIITRSEKNQSHHC